MNVKRMINMLFLLTPLSLCLAKGNNIQLNLSELLNQAPRLVAHSQFIQIDPRKSYELSCQLVPSMPSITNKIPRATICIGQNNPDPSACSPQNKIMLSIATNVSGHLQNLKFSDSTVPIVAESTSSEKKPECETKFGICQWDYTIMCNLAQEQNVDS